MESGSQGTCVWWTNNLLKTTQYRVKVKNGACPSVYSPVYTVTVKPKLGVTITANKTVLCPPGPVILTAQTTYGPPCNYPVSYQWYRDGLPIAGATGSTYSPTTGGNYYVVVSETCGKATSNVITVCGRPQLVIEAPCCVCPGETVTVNAVVVWTPQNCPAPSCTYLWNTGATTPSISVTSPGTYTVTVNCGTCPPMTQSVIIQPCL
ncbi:MAG: PKD domain-containing protein [Bacteroidetes bacterium]|nr:PKD domain-containing protein [Bacteroidota bacterium]